MIWLCGFTMVLGGGRLVVAAQDEASAVTPGAVSPTAIRGVDLLVPLRIPKSRIAWPTTVSANIGGSDIKADVVWIVNRLVEDPLWTSPATGVEIFQMPVGPREPLPGVPVALLPIPEDADGAISMLGAVWSPVWLDAPPEPSPDAAIVPSRGPDADPVLDDPLEWFRWRLLADLMDARPPEPRLSNDLSVRLAEAIAAEWRSALLRVASSSPGAASEIGERLTAAVEDPARPVNDRMIAAWPTDQRGLAGLRSLLLDPARTPAEAVQAGLAWFDARPSFLAIETSTGGDRVEIDLINPTHGELVILAAWESEPAEIALIAPPRSISRHEIERPDVGGGVLPTDEVLDLRHGGRSVRLPCGPRAIPVRPPGASFGTFILPRTLAGVDGGFVQATAPLESTQAVLRRRNGRWELFIEARHLGASTVGDRLFIQVGDQRRPAGVIQIDSTGDWKRLAGVAAPSLTVEVRSFVDRWRCSVLLPEAWLVEAISGGGRGSVLVGIRRDGPGSYRQHAGTSVPVWRRDIIPLAFSINDWNHAPSEVPPAP
ncbi:MAG: hypothetical protein OSA40_10540 [Phycisphaerales bacterium]|nr:hypothetical protein [Phycisphaerales bacterium]